MSKDLELPEEWEKKFFESLVNEHAIVGRAAKAAGVSVQVIERRRRESVRFAQMLDHVEAMIDEALEYESLRRAIEPNERPVFARGQMVGIIREYDTKHLEWVLERRKPEKYHLPTMIELGGGRDSDVTFKLALGDQEPTPELGVGDDS